jgi:hypothetical protein
MTQIAAAEHGRAGDADTRQAAAWCSSTTLAVDHSSTHGAGCSLRAAALRQAS